MQNLVNRGAGRLQENVAEGVDGTEFPLPQYSAVATSAVS
jgi:hypothetical protein